MRFERRCWAQVDLDALRHNFAIVKQAAAGTPVMAVVKADAYGHGDAAVAKLLAQEGAAWFAVSGFEEALHLRRAGVEQPILVLGYTSPQYARGLAENRITQTLYSTEYARALSAAAVEAGVTVQVHVKIDTGMGRIGFPVRDDLAAAVDEIAAALALPALAADGIFTHFAVADSILPAHVAYTRHQHELVEQTVAALAQRGITFRNVHCCNSAGIFAYPEFHHDLVRAGIILYGENPSDDVRLAGLQPALCVKAAVSLVKDIAAGDSESYGCTFTAAEPMRVATIAVGYADGYPRQLSGRGTVSLHGRPARVLGRVCMDQLIVDVTHIPEVKMGDIATVCGGDAADSILDIAHATNTINYEVLCDIGRRVPRVYVEDGREVHMVNYLREV